MNMWGTASLRQRRSDGLRLLAIGFEGLLILGVALVTAWSLWQAVTPLPAMPDGAALPHGQQRSVDRALLARYDSFWTLGGAAAPAADAGGWVLHGVRAAPDPGYGSAILSRGGADQRAFFVGDEVAPGVVLEAVGLDHAVLGQGSGVIELFIDNSRPPPMRAAQPPAASGGAGAAGAGAADAQGTMAALLAGLSPRLDGGRLTGLAVTSGEGAALGLQPGDIILAINDIQPESLAALADLPALLPASGPYRLRIERDNAETLVTID